MTDTVIKGSGNSRSLKTVPNALTMYPTHEAMISAMVDGTFPIDLGPLNMAGLNVKGTDLNKASLLTDALCSALELETTATPTEAMEKLRQLINTTDSKISGLFVSGSYAGNGANSKTLNFKFDPTFVFIIPWNPVNDFFWFGVISYLGFSLPVKYSTQQQPYTYPFRVTKAKNKITWSGYQDGYPDRTLNYNGNTYLYVAIA